MDTNVILHYLKDTPTRKLIEERFDPFGEENEAIISVVTIAEIGVLGRRNDWGNRRFAAVEKIYDDLIIVDITSNDIIQAYIDIDSFSEGSHPTKAYKESSRNMGKNDLWIAATALVAEAELITTDKDFVHLNDDFMRINLVIL